MPIQGILIVPRIDEDYLIAPVCGKIILVAEVPLLLPYLVHDARGNHLLHEESGVIAFPFVFDEDRNHRSILLQKDPELDLKETQSRTLYLNIRRKRAGFCRLIRP